MAPTEHDPEAYGRSIGEEYDALYEDVLDTESQVALLADLAEEGPVLEMGIGTGRLALPLAARGLDVAGIEASQVMVERLRAKAGGERIPVVVGDFAEAQVPGPFALVVLAFNTIFALPDQEAQVRCFANAASHLAPDGLFVVEAEIPDLVQFRHGPSLRPRPVGGDRVALVIAEHDQVRQHIETTQVHLSPSGVRLHPVNHRYAWPSELDLMARLAGLRLRARWRGWSGEPFTAASKQHVSIYDRDGHTSL